MPLLLLVVVAMLVLSLMRLPPALRMVGTALLIGLPALGGTVMFVVAKGNTSMTNDRATYAVAGALAGWILGAVLLQLFRARLPAQQS